MPLGKVIIFTFQFPFCDTKFPTDQYMGGAGPGPGVSTWSSEMDISKMGDDAMAFGRQGYGAPVRDKTG